MNRGAGRAGNKLQQVALEDTPAGKETKNIAEQVYVSRLLADLPLDRRKRQRILPGPGSTILDRFQLLAHVSSPARTTFFRDVIGRIADGCRDASFLLAVLKRAGYTLTKEERRGLLQTLGGLAKRPRMAGAWVALAHSARSFPEAQEIVRECGPAHLRACRSRQLREYLATIEGISLLRGIKFPEAPSKYVSSEKKLGEVQATIDATYGAARNLLRTHLGWAGSTQRYTHLRNTLATAQIDFRRQCAMELSARERNQLVRTEVAKLAFQLKYGLSLVPAKDESTTAKPWAIEELHVVLKALKKIGDYRVIIAHGLRGFRRCEKLEGSIIAQHESAGLIRIGDVVFDAKSKGALEDRAGLSAEDIVIHELGHALSLSYCDSSVIRTDAAHRVALEEIFVADHFPSAFLRHGRWNSEPGDWAIHPGGESATIRRKTKSELTIPLGVPVAVDGETRVYKHFGLYDLLLWYDPNRGQFPPVWYGHEDPSEHMAELYTCYFGERRGVVRLIQTAPHLFWYMDSLYQRYQGDSAITNLLRRRLTGGVVESSRRRGPGAESLQQALFKMLTDGEQAAIFRELGLAPADLERPGVTRTTVEGWFGQTLKNAKTATMASIAIQNAVRDYKPGVLWARELLHCGADVEVVSIRGTTQHDVNAQQPVHDLVCTALGPRLQEDKIFFLNDAHRSRRLGTGSFHNRLQVLLAERLDGLSPRATGGTKALPDHYSGIALYTAIPATADFLRRYASARGLESRLHVVDMSRIHGEAGVARLRSEFADKVRGRGEFLHVFTLEDTLLTLPAEFRIMMRGNPRALRSLSVRQFLTKEDPKDWLREVSRESGVALRELMLDSTEFSSRVASREQIRLMSGKNKLLKIDTRRRR